MNKPVTEIKCPKCRGVGWFSLKSRDQVFAELLAARATIAEANAIIKSLTCQPEDRT